VGGTFRRRIERQGADAVGIRGDRDTFLLPVVASGDEKEGSDGKTRREAAGAR